MPIMSTSDSSSNPTTLEDVFPLSEIFCLPLYVDFLIHATVIAVSIIINHLIFFHIYSEKWIILKHYNNLNSLPNNVKISIMQNHHKENLKIIDVLSIYISNQDIVNLVYSYLEHSSQMDIFQTFLSHKSSLSNTGSPNYYRRLSSLSPRAASFFSFKKDTDTTISSVCSIDIELDENIKPALESPKNSNNSPKDKTYEDRTGDFGDEQDGETEPMTLEDRMEEIVNKTKNDDMPIWRDKEYLNRYLSPYINNLVIFSSVYSLIVLIVEFLTFILIIYEFSAWFKVSSFPNSWNYYNGWCIVTSLIQPFLRYYKFLFFYTWDFGSYHPHHLNWDNIMNITSLNSKWKYLISKVNIIQIILSLIMGIMWIPLLPGAILLMLAIFCFITALGVPFYILYAIFQYFRECYFIQNKGRLKICDYFIRGLQQFTLHLMILIILSSIHFCLYSSILSTSVSLYGAKDVVGCLNYEWDWKIHKWHWKNIAIVISWILV